MSHELAELLRLLEKLTHRKEITVSQVQLSVTFSVASGVSPLTVTPATLSESLTVGTPVPSSTIATVTGGVPPYTYTLDASSGPLPTGVNFSEDGSGNISLTGTPTTAGTSTSAVLLDISDAASPAARASMRLIK